MLPSSSASFVVGTRLDPGVDDAEEERVDGLRLNSCSLGILERRAASLSSSSWPCLFDRVLDCALVFMAHVSFGCPVNPWTNTRLGNINQFPSIPFYSETRRQRVEQTYSTTGF